MIHVSSSVAGKRIRTVWTNSAGWGIAIVALLLCVGCVSSERQPNVRSSGIEMVAVQSSAMTAVGYDGQNSTLRIRFIQGAEYDYSGVPPEIYQGLLSAESKGKYYHGHIKGNYPHKRVR